MNNDTIAFIGCGNMGRCLIKGLVADGFPPQQIHAADPSAEQLERLGADLPIAVCSDNAEAVKDAEVVVLAVKPQQMRSVATALAPSLGANPLVLSIAAGIRTGDLRRWLGKPAIVRAMPNTPALLQCGATGLYAGSEVGEDQRETAEAILRAAGLTVWVDNEDLLDAVTAVSGSGPAYFFLVMELVENAGVRLGLNREQARILTLQTALGSARMAMESGVDPAALRAQVTSPGGTTDRALAVMGESNLAGIFDAALEAASERAAEMAREFGAD